MVGIHSSFHRHSLLQMDFLFIEIKSGFVAVWCKLKQTSLFLCDHILVTMNQITAIAQILHHYICLPGLALLEIFK